MMNHKWKDNVCVNCGVKKRKAWAETWVHVGTSGIPFYKASNRRKLVDAFSFDNENWTAERPQCNKQSVLIPKIICEHKNHSTNYSGESGWCFDCKKWIPKTELLK